MKNLFKQVCCGALISLCVSVLLLPLMLFYAWAAMAAVSAFTFALVLAACAVGVLLVNGGHDD